MRCNGCRNFKFTLYLSIHLDLGVFYHCTMYIVNVFKDCKMCMCWITCANVQCVQLEHILHCIVNTVHVVISLCNLYITQYTLLCARVQASPEYH